MTAPTVHQKKQPIIPDGAYSYFSWLIPLMGLALFSLGISWLVLDPLSPFIGAVLWLAIYFSWGFRIVDNMEYLVIQRLGEFNRIVHPGPRILCLPGLIDTEKPKVVIRPQEIKLFADEVSPYKVDFACGASAPVHAKAWYRIGPKDQTKLKEIDKAIYDFTYTLKGEDAIKERLEDVLESSFVPRLQALELSKALVEKDTVAEESVSEAVKDALKINGIELIEEKGFIITDIVIPDDIMLLRKKKLEGETEASKQKELGSGYANAIVGIINTAKAAGKDISWETAQHIYETQRGLETAVDMKNTTFVASSMQGILNMIGVNNAHHNDKQTLAEGRAAS